MFRFAISFSSILNTKEIKLATQSSISGAVMTVTDAADFTADLATKFLNGGCTTLKIESVSALPTGTSKAVFDYVQILDLTNSQISEITASYFESNNAIQEVKLKSGTSILNKAFKYSSIKTINWDAITSIGQSGFEGCPNIGAVTCRYNLGDSAFASSGITSLELNNNANIANSLCSNCRSLTTVILRSSFSVGNYAFQNCFKLSNIPADKISSVGTGSFQNCYALTSFQLQSTGSGFSIGNSAFENSGLKDLKLPADYYPLTVSARAFYGCKLVTFIVEKKLQLSSECFANNKDLTTVTFAENDNTYSLPEKIFYGCSKLATVNLEKVATIASNAFYGCSSLSTIDLSSCTTVGDFAFQKCAQLSTITFPATITLGQYAFSGITGPETMELSTGITYGKYVFSGATGIKSVKMISNAPEGIFANCQNLESADFTGISRIPDYCFYNCPKFTISGGVVPVSPGKSAFEGTGLSGELTVNNGYNDRSFASTKITSLKISQFPTATQAFCGCRQLTTVTFLSNFNPINFNAENFVNCTALTTFDVTAAANFAFENGILYNKDKNQILLYAPGNSGAEYTISSNVEVRPNAFVSAYNLRTLKVSSRILLNENSFAKSYFITTFTETADTNMRSLPKSCFKGCFALSKIEFQSTIYSAGQECFANCYKLTSITGDKIYTGEDSLFANCLSLSTISINNMLDIPANCFSGCSQLSTVTANAAASVKNSAFLNCYNLNSFNHQDNLVSLEDYSFGLCGLKSFTINANLIDLTNLAFYQTNCAITVDSNNPVFMATSKELINKLSGELIKTFSITDGIYTPSDKVTTIDSQIWQVPEGKTLNAKDSTVNKFDILVIPSTVRTVDTSFFSSTGVYTACFNMTDFSTDQVSASVVYTKSFVLADYIVGNCQYKYPFSKSPNRMNVLNILECPDFEENVENTTNPDNSKTVDASKKLNGTETGLIVFVVILVIILVVLLIVYFVFLREKKVQARMPVQTLSSPDQNQNSPDQVDNGEQKQPDQQQPEQQQPQDDLNAELNNDDEQVPLP